jgi:catecholate siderophore receptor
MQDRSRPGAHGAKPSRKRVGKAWITLGTVAAYAAVSLTKSVPAWAQNVPASGDDKGQQGLMVRRLEIPAGPLDQVISAYKRASGIEVTFSVDAATIAGFNSPGVSGLYTEDQALRAILVGTGLGYHVDNTGKVTIGVSANESIVVEDTSPSIALDRYPVPLLDTPQSVSTISQAVMHEEGATTLRDALRNAPGISLAAGEGGSQGDNLTLRGFTARNDIFLDGMRDFGSYYRDPFNYQEVEVLEGPSGVTFGRGSTGGVINQESKTPVDHPFVVMDGDFGTDLTRRFTADINEPLDQLGHGAAFRLNLMGNESNVAERDVTENRRFGLAPTLAFGLGTPTRVTAGYFHFNEDDIPDYGIPWYFNRAAPVPRHNYYGFRDGSYLRTEVDMVTLKAEHDISDWLTIRNKARFANNQRDARITEPQVNTATSGLITPSTPLPQISVNRNQIAVFSNEGFLWDQLDATARLKTFGIRHVVVIGAEGGKETSDPVRPTFSYVNPAGTTINTVPTTNMLQPNENQNFSGTSAPSSNVHVTSTSYGLYLLDTMQLGRFWELVGGARFDRFYTEEKSIAYPTPVMATGSAVTQGAPTITYPNRLDRKPSWRAAAVFKPTSYGSIYFDYGTSFNPSAEALSLTVGPVGSGTANLAPEFNRSYEVGTKWDLNNARLSLRADLFRTTKDNAREASPTNSLLYVLAGTQRVNGAEAVVNGRIMDRWHVLSSYTFMHSEVVKSQYYPASVGYRLANVPNDLFNIWTIYEPVHRLTIGAGGNYVDSRTASSTVPRDPTTGFIKEVPAYIVLNAMGSYSLSDNLSFQVNVFNLANRNYIDEIHPGHIVPGAGTSGLFGLTFRF